MEAGELRGDVKFDVYSSESAKRHVKSNSWGSGLSVPASDLLPVRRGILLTPKYFFTK